MAQNEGRAIVFGTSFIANPDLVERYCTEDALNSVNSNTFYTPDESGYTDYPAMLAGCWQRHQQIAETQRSCGNMTVGIGKGNRHIAVDDVLEMVKQ